MTADDPVFWMAFAACLGILVIVQIVVAAWESEQAARRQRRVEEDRDAARAAAEDLRWHLEYAAGMRDEAAEKIREYCRLAAELGEGRSAKCKMQNAK